MQALSDAWVDAWNAAAKFNEELNKVKEPRSKKIDPDELYAGQKRRFDPDDEEDPPKKPTEKGGAEPNEQAKSGSQPSEQAKPKEQAKSGDDNKMKEIERLEVSEVVERASGKAEEFIRALLEHWRKGTKDDAGGGEKAPVVPKLPVKEALEDLVQPLTPLTEEEAAKDPLKAIGAGELVHTIAEAVVASLFADAADAAVADAEKDVDVTDRTKLVRAAGDKFEEDIRARWQVMRELLEELPTWDKDEEPEKQVITTDGVTKVVTSKRTNVPEKDQAAITEAVVQLMETVLAKHRRPEAKPVRLLGWPEAMLTARRTFKDQEPPPKVAGPLKLESKPMPRGLAWISRLVAAIIGDHSPAPS